MLNPHTLSPVPRRPLPGFAYLSHVTMDVSEDLLTRVLAWALFVTFFFKSLSSRHILKYFQTMCVEFASKLSNGGGRGGVFG